GDSIQLARIHANLSSRAVEEGDYARAIEEADLALRTGAGHSLFAAVAAHNKAEALMHRGELEEAHALLGQAIEMFSSLGSLAGCMSYALLGAIESERGELARARVTLERAVRLSAESDDVHSLALARAGLARVLAPDDPEAARAHAAAAVAAATSLERAAALCARAWVELVAGDHAAAVRSAIEAEREARRTGDRPALAGALELAGAASRPPDETRLESALALWHELGDPIAGARTGLVLALCREQAGEAQARREELARRGAAPEVGIAGVLAARAGASARRAAGAGAGAGAAEVAITTLGRFAVLRRGEPVPLPAWQSRKARDLLKLLAARRGRPLTRDAAAEALWPDEGPEPLANRLSVALSTLRRVLDPERRHPPDHFVAAEQQALALRMEHVSVDVVRFLAAAHEGVHMAAQGEWERAEAGLREAERLYTGDFLEEDLYEDWAVDCREEARAAAQEVSRLLARAAIRRGDEEEGARHLRRLLERDPYDADAWTALVGAQVRLHRYGEARRQHAVYARRMGELGVAPVALAATTAARP
ncbi:MAG TPA: BTAD domain-containing putative transcriptional regulator, partial [Solirubrobacteraceae bacterium]|nr:BTAD domain-containing putative transcriptional regulator [Solirubrobacteraceae bacterium]